MFKLDNDFLTSLGLGGLPIEEKNKLLQMIYERLEMNVGMRLAEKMTDQQLDEFESFIDQNDEAGALKWLESNFPNYKDVVAEELEKLKNEVTAAAPQILATSPSNGGFPGQQMPAIAQNPFMPGVPASQPSFAPQPMQQPAPQPVFDPTYQTPIQQPVMPPQYSQQPAQMPQPQYSQPMQQPYTQPAPQPMQQPAPQPVFDPTYQTPIQQPVMPPQYSQQPAQPQQFTPPPPGFIPGQ